VESSSGEVSKAPEESVWNMNVQEAGQSTLEMNEVKAVSLCIEEAKGLSIRK